MRVVRRALVAVACLAGAVALGGCSWWSGAGEWRAYDLIKPAQLHFGGDAGAIDWVRMPDLAGRPFDAPAIEKRLCDAGLTVAGYSGQTGASGHVVATAPMAGSRVPRGWPVTVLVGTPPGEIFVGLPGSCLP